MKIDTLKSNYDANFNELQSLVTTALSQVIQKEIVLEKEILQDNDLKSMVIGEEFPRVIISFSSGIGPNESRNLFVLQEEFVLQFYAWMIADEPAESIADDHLDGLSESVQQVFGQLKMAVADDQASFQLNNLNVLAAKTPEDLADYLPEEIGIACTYYVSVEEAAYPVNHYFWLPNMEEAASGEPEESGQEPDATVDVMPAEFSSLAGFGDGNGSDRNVDVLMDVELEVSVEIDRKMILISDLLKLGKGSIIELEKSAGEPLDIFVNGRKFAEGEVVVVDDRFGIRITQLLSPKERVKSLG